MNPNMKEILKVTKERGLDLVAIYWEDITSFHGWQEMGGRFDNITPFSVGFLINETKTHYYLAQTYCADDVVGDVMSIPKSNVIAIHHLGVGNKRK